MMTQAGDRLRGALWGMFVGDALCLGSHWHYDLEKRDREVYPGGMCGFDRPIAAHYHAGREPGDPTHYGDGALLLLQSVTEHRGFDAAACGKAWVEHFSSGYSGYLDKATRGVIELFPTTGRGGDDRQTGGMAKMAAIVAITPEEELEATVERAVRVFQDNDEAVALNLVFALLLRALLDGRSVSEAIDGAGIPGTLMQAVEEALPLPVIEATGRFGRACNLEQTFPSVLHAFLRDGHSFTTPMLETARAGGDNAARAAVLGALLGARHGLGAIPPLWIERLRERQRIAPLVEASGSLAAERQLA
ncbi:MAG: ADP-ribosylglycohydrolase family protein [Geminicoccaceae bacterium]